jgi:thioredoxin-dependent peroxiredoxin
MAEQRKGAVNWKGAPTDLLGPELKPSDKAPNDFTLVGSDMSPVTGKDLSGKPRIVCAVPSLDTPVCDVEMRRFNSEAEKIPGVNVFVVSLDLPFAQKRWCVATSSDRVKALSDYKDRSFGPAYGVLAPSKGLFARAVFVIDGKDVIRHVEYVADVASEPDYAAALAAAKQL